MRVLTTLDVKDYFRFPLTERQEIDAWLRRSGGDPHCTFRITVTGEGVGEADVYELDESGSRFLCDNGEPAARKQPLVLSEPPPWRRP